MISPTMMMETEEAESEASEDTIEEAIYTILLKKRYFASLFTYMAIWDQ